MRSEVINYLDNDPELWDFLHQNPDWYHKLSRHPELVSDIKGEADDYFGRSFKKKVEHFTDYLNMVNMFMEMSTVLTDPKDTHNKSEQEN